MLAILSTTMPPLFVIPGIFGMNVLYPGEGTTWLFWIILGLMLSATLGMLGLLRWKRWL